MIVFYFTSTGNSLYVSKQICNEIENVELKSIPLELKKECLDYEDEEIGFVFPTYEFNAPKIVKEFLQKGNFKAKYIFLIMTYGNIMADALEKLTTYAAKNGIKVDYTARVLMVDNYLPQYSIEKQLKKHKSTKKDINQAINDIKHRKQNIQKGNIIDKIASGGVGIIEKMNPDMFSSKNITVNSSICIHCGTCAKVCPRGNITVTKEEVKIGKECEFCLGCVNNCPKNAMCLKHDASPNLRYRNKNITVAEIIKSNHQLSK